MGPKELGGLVPPTKPRPPLTLWLHMPVEVEPGLLPSLRETSVLTVSRLLDQEGKPEWGWVELGPPWPPHLQSWDKQHEAKTGCYRPHS